MRINGKETLPSFIELFAVHAIRVAPRQETHFSGVETFIKLCTYRQDETKSLTIYFRKFEARKEASEVIVGLTGIVQGGEIFPRMEELHAKETCNSRPIFNKGMPKWHESVMEWDREHCMAVLAVKTS